MNAIVVTSSNGRSGIAAAMAVLRAGGTALDAVEAGARCVEDDPADDTVGTGGLPNLLGEVELDASIMDGRTLAAGAVAAMRRHANPISVARRVMTDLPHVLLAGDGADRFADECGFPQVSPLTEQAAATWRRWLQGVMPQDASPNDLAYYTEMRTWVARATLPGHTGGTVNFLALDRDGNIASAASTSGWAFSYPGRLGDSPLIGAGNYCDNRYGAAACTGRGEMAIRAATAHSVVFYLKLGRSLAEALAAAQRDLWTLDDPLYGAIKILALDRQGNHAGAANIAAS
jgi:beta-aspartyl-peptidase (threonine type)